MKRILLLGAYGQRNLGDDALLEVFIAQLGDARLLVNSAQPDETRRRHGVETLATYRSWMRPGWLRALLGADAVVFGGGSLLKEIEGGALARLLYLLRILLLLIACRLLGRPTAMLGVGVGPLERPLFRRISLLAASLTDLICVRDEESRAALESLGLRRPAVVTADPVFLMESRGQAGAAPGGPPEVVVIPRYSLSEAEIGALAAACDHLADAYGARVTLAPFQTGYQDRFDDMAAARAVLARMRRADAARVVSPESPGEAYDLVGRAAMVVSARLHGLIFAAMQGVPVVAIDYEVKVRSFMEQVGEGRAAVSLPDLGAGRLAAALDDAWARRGETAARLRGRAAELRGRSRESFTALAELLAKPRGGGALTGGALLLVSMTVVNVGNYVSNLVLGRWLGPAAFADFSLMITGFLIVTLVTSTLQTISAKFAATHAAAGEPEAALAMRAFLGRWAWLIGGATLALFALGAPLWQQFFHTTSPWPFVILGLGLPFYYAQGIGRGALQGQTRFGALAATYQIEMWARLVFAVGLVALGLSVNGAVAGITISLVVAWVAARWPLDGMRLRLRAPALGPEERRAILAFSGPVATALVGQVVINNSDILIIKHFFPAEAAGHYAALALIGRVVFFATLSVVAAMFPIVAQRQARGEPHRHLLWAALGIVLAASGVVIVGTWALPELMVRLLFGAAYLPIAPLLWLYAVATLLYAMANVVINYRLSAGDGGGARLVMVAGAVQVAALWLFHDSLHQVVLIQVFLMLGLFGALMAWDQLLARRGAKAAHAQGPGLGAQLRRRWRSILFGGLTLLFLLAMWQVAGAQPSRAGNPAQDQIKEILPALRDSEAEQANGAYIPGVGAVITLDLLRGPNTFKDKAPAPGVHDWAYYLMGAFGPRLTAVPPDETIAISISYYDFSERTYHQLVITSLARDVKDSGTYATWLDGQPQNEPARQRDAAPARQAAAPAGQAPASGAITFDGGDPGGQWATAGGQWELADGGYAQRELGRYDLAAILDRQAAGSYQVQVDLKYLAGDMGGGLIFGAPNAADKRGAHMVSYSERGAYVQWGSYDADGTFRFAGGSPVPSGADGKWHTLTVQVTGQSYSVALDGAALVEGVPLQGPADGRVGLLASTSSVIFDNLKLEAR